MELSKNIFFNTDKLVQDSTVKIYYAGDLFENGSEDIFIHYGFDNDWKELNEVKMEKTDMGYQAEIALPSYETFNFCFRDSNNVWDNNDNSNYIFPLEKSDVALIIREELGIDTKRHLRKTYLWSKKIRLAVYKLLIYVPKIISGNYKRKVLD